MKVPFSAKVEEDAVQELDAYAEKTHLPKGYIVTVALRRLFIQFPKERAAVYDTQGDEE